MGTVSFASEASTAALPKMGACEASARQSHALWTCGLLGQRCAWSKVPRRLRAAAYQVVPTHGNRDHAAASREIGETCGPGTFIQKPRSIPLNRSLTTIASKYDKTPAQL